MDSELDLAGATTSSFAKKMNQFLYIASVIGILAVVGCKESTSNEESTKLKKVTEEVQPIELSNLGPTPQHEKIASSEIGSDLNDAIRVLGARDLVGDVHGDAKGQYYPFSNRGGYDYIIQIAGDSSIQGVWRRPTVMIRQSEQAAPSNH